MPLFARIRLNRRDLADVMTATRAERMLMWSWACSSSCASLRIMVQHGFQVR